MEVILSNFRGAIPVPRHMRRTVAGDLCGDPDDAPLAAWFNHCLPATNQNGPSCVGQAWANWLELMLRCYVGRGVLAPGEQIDGEAIWRRGRELFWGGTLDDGLYLSHGFHAMLDLGILPPGTELVQVAQDWRSIGRALLHTPLVQGHVVHEGWLHPDPRNGCLDHAPAPVGNGAGHATLCVGRLVKDGQRYRAGQNSWGTSWGWHGLFVLTDEEDAEGRMNDGPYTAVLPDDWTSYPGWRKAVTRQKT